MTHDRSAAPSPIRQLRLVVAAERFEEALAFYRDTLGLSEQAAFEGEGDARVVILDAGRATLELANPAQVRLIDGIETDGHQSPPLRLAFEVDDAAGTTERLAAAGATVIASARQTPWRSLNARLAGPADLELTVFEELESLETRAARPGFTAPETPPNGAVEPAELPLPGGGTVRLRPAVEADVPAIVALFAADPLSASRGDAVDPALLPRYRAAFAAIAADPAHRLVVVTDARGEVVGTSQLTLIPGLVRLGLTRLQIEAVHVRGDQRGRGIGGAMIAWALEQAPALGAGLVQLTSDASRVEAHRFYERLGFTGSHRGFKYLVPSPDAD